ncbi:TIGR03936 family radical SAM-associated protein [Sphaerisporangium sp. TRM90804]|uniref:TIGR03936 family radical SAM-associated protein n=1 Tax=Sphaerisporangium sp. TRM90804 TaxID=3031113 RepID=UPI00244963CC|nr:TIGR03936 family radical SAM-associated protein [Sphaerisporangium sp. TRM90804]MDH2428126.1 TIGR03936 family radical SAM-associated protein [Sphaerisporangium sp. TRM90804]
MVQRLRVRYAKRGRLRFTSHRDISRAVERAVRRAGIPVGFSAGFSPHPKISYAGAAPTGVASEAEYLEIGVVTTYDPERLRADLDSSLPPGLDVLDVVEARVGSLADRLESSVWELRLPGAEPADVTPAVERFLAEDRVEVERLTKKGLRRFDAREAVVALTVHESADAAAGREPGRPCAILRMVVRHVTPAVRPDDVLTGLRRVAEFAPPSPPEVTRLAQGPLDVRTGATADPLDLDRDVRGGEPGPAVRLVDDHK